jgi:hypothetical protein
VTKDFILVSAGFEGVVDVDSIIDGEKPKQKNVNEIYVLVLVSSSLTLMGKITSIRRNKAGLFLSANIASNSANNFVILDMSKKVNGVKISVVDREMKTLATLATDKDKTIEYEINYNDDMAEIVFHVV